MISNSTAIAEVSSRISTNLILCTPSVPLCIGMLVREWKKVNSLKLVRILQHWKRTTRRLALRQQREKERRRAMVMNSELTSLSTTALSIISRATLQLDGQLDAADSNA